jgi:hypothetical protein
MENFISIDPGTRKVGWCIWDKGRPVKWGCVRIGRAKGGWQVRLSGVIRGLRDKVGLGVWELVVVEMPAVWDAKKAGSVVKLAMAAGVLGGVLVRPDRSIGGLGKREKWIAGGKVLFVPVGVWKGQVGKGVTARRMKRRYSISVKGEVGCGGDTYDAIGVGDWYVRKRKWR